MRGVREQDEHLFKYLGDPINPSPEKRTFQRRTPVNAAELRFMRQRLEAEPVTTATENTITGLLELERAYAAGEHRG